MTQQESVMAAINMIAEKIVKALADEGSAGGKSGLGFHRRADMSNSTLIRAWIGRCGPGEKFCWYHLAGDRDNPVQQPIEEYDCVTGKLVDLQLMTREYKGKESQKLNLTLEAGESLISLTTGMDTVAGRSIIRGLLGHLEKGQITGLITVQVKPGDSEGTVLATVLHDGEWAYSEPLQDPEHAVRMIQHSMKFRQKDQGSHEQSASVPTGAPAAAARAAKPVDETIPF